MKLPAPREPYISVAVIVLSAALAFVLLVLLNGCAAPDFYTSQRVPVFVRDDITVSDDTREQLDLAIDIAVDKLLDARDSLEYGELLNALQHSSIVIEEQVPCRGDGCFDGSTMHIELLDECPETYMVLHEIGHLYRVQFHGDWSHDDARTFRDYRVPLQLDGGSYEADAERQLLEEACR